MTVRGRIFEYFMGVTVKRVNARDPAHHIYLSRHLKGHGKMAEWSKACDSSESLPEPIRFLICVCRQGFESPSCQPFYPSSHGSVHEIYLQLVILISDVTSRLGLRPGRKGSPLQHWQTVGHAPRSAANKAVIAARLLTKLLTSS